MSGPRDEQPVVFCATQEELEAWLEEHHDSPDGIWLKLAKKSSGIRSVTYAEAVEAALSFLIDAVGIDRIVLGSDWPFVGWDPSPSGWIKGLKSLSADDKERILSRNVEKLLGL